MSDIQFLLMGVGIILFIKVLVAVLTVITQKKQNQ